MFYYPSGASDEEVARYEQKPAHDVVPVEKGISFKYYEGPFTRVMEFESEGKLVDAGVMQVFDITGAKSSNHFGYEFDCWFYAPESDLYDFFLSSDDGALLKIDGDIVVADNGSTDDSLQWLRLNYPDVRVIRLDRNYGFAGGYNRALREVESEYVLLLNSDVEVTAGWWQPLVEVLDTESDVAAVAPKLLADMERTKFEYAGAAGGFIDYLGYPFCRGRILSNVEEDRGQYDDRRDIFWASGAAMCCRRELFESLGGFDEDFFAHMEEIDLQWRMQLAGWRIVVEPKSVVYHLGGGIQRNQHPFDFSVGVGADVEPVHVPITAQLARNDRAKCLIKFPYGHICSPFCLRLYQLS